MLWLESAAALFNAQIARRILADAAWRYLGRAVIVP
jgi:hypothetical protein